MKECAKCGAPQAEHEVFCAQCGEKLPVLNPDVDSSTDSSVSHSFHYKDPLRVSIADAVAGILTIAVIIGYLIYGFLRIPSGSALHLANFFLICVLGLNTFRAFKPEYDWDWYIRRMSYYSSDQSLYDKEPSPLWIFSRKCSLWIVLAISAGLLFLLTEMK